MNRRMLCTALVAVVPSAVRAQETSPVRAVFDSAAVAWSAGDYIDALARLERVLTSPDAAAVLAPAALLTGELYAADSIAPDGREPRWSADGRYLAYSTGSGPNRKTLVVDATRKGQVRATLAARGLVFAPSGKEVAFFDVAETAATAVLRLAVDSAIRARDAEAFRRLRSELARAEGEAARVFVRDLRTGRSREVRAPGLVKQALAYAGNGRSLYLVAGTGADPTRGNVYELAGAAPPVPVIDAPGSRSALLAAPGGRLLVYVEGTTLAVRDLEAGTVRTFRARAYSAAPDNSAIVFVERDSAANALTLLELAPNANPRVLLRSARPIDNPAISPDRTRVVYQMMPREDWELYLIGIDGTGARRLTHEVQHDLLPRFLTADRVLAVIGESRHRRSYLYDLRTGERTRLFHNNSVRTVSAEYEWAASGDGTKVAIVAERDGDTISPERSVYVTDLSRSVTVPELLARVRTGLAAERALREQGTRTFAPIQARVRDAADAVSVSRIYDYERALYGFDSKYITQPGNARAIEYLSAQLRGFGYEPELQWFEPQPGVRSANVVARLAGRSNPELVYVVSSHFDSVEEGPGSDDDTSGTAALLDAARVLATRPQAATIEFAFFTGEEAGLLGSREFVRRAVADGKRIVGALNNDMIGFANDERLDNTIRYSNDGLRDLQHAAAFLFTALITYDARYYKSTDAHAYFEQYGDIVGGIGSYPILGNPHYHQPHDVLETVNHRLIAEVSRTTVASVMAMASAPSRIAGLAAVAGPRGATISWQPAPERGVTGYVLVWGPAGDATRERFTVTEPRAVLPGAGAGTRVAVKALGAEGMEGWDWVRGVVR